MQVPYSHQTSGDFIAPGQAERIHALALRILREVGLEVAHAEARDQLAGRPGFSVQGERVFIQPALVEEYLEERRRRREAEMPAEGNGAAEDDHKLHLTVGVYAHHVHDLATDRIVPYTTAQLIEMTKLVDVLDERGVHSPSPGYPLDVAPAMQPLAQYRVGACYSRHGQRPVDPISTAAIPYVMEMAEVLGHPLRSLPVYVFSPLRLAGESLEGVLQYRDRLDSVFVSNMPSVGATAPISPFAALATAAAESIGGAIIVGTLTGLPTGFGVGLHAIDLRFGTMVFGSPESYLFGQLNAEINEFYDSGRRRARHQRGNASAGIHSRANFPGPQAAAEKAAIMTAGALLGVRWFSGAGTLSVDEVFSPEQLLIDCEIKDQTQRLIEGLDMGEDWTADWIEEVRRGVAGSFVALDSTLDHYRQVYWHPQLFDRGFLASQGYEGRLKLAQRARDMVADYISRHEFELEADKRRELDRIYARAERELAGK